MYIIFFLTIELRCFEKSFRANRNWKMEYCSTSICNSFKAKANSNLQNKSHFTPIFFLIQFIFLRMLCVKIIHLNSEFLFQKCGQLHNLVLFKPSTSACIRFNFFSVVINSDYGLHNWILVTIAINPGCSIAVNMKDVEVN